MLLVMLVVLVPAPVFAQQPSGPQGGLDQIKDKFPQGSQLARSDTVGGLAREIIRILVILTLTVCVLFIIFGGFLYITSAGNEDRAKKGRQTLKYAIIGLIAIVMSYAIAIFVVNYLNSPNV
jgi:uncharacterized membrane protein YwzB